MTNATAFIDQNLAAQLFVAARAHDSLRQETDTLLPTVISEIFTLPSNNSHRYRTATYSALAKSQQSINQPTPTTATSTTSVTLQRLNTINEENTRKESKLLLIARHEPRILKKIATYLGINDKQSLMFAVTEENMIEKEDNNLSTSSDISMQQTKPSGSTTATTTLAEDIYHRELEELDHLRSEYLTQLAQTREYESKMDDLQQQIDRTKLILDNMDSGDLLLLNYMASRLYLLRELTSRDYDDFFTARAQYSSWCKEQQQLYFNLSDHSLQNQKKLLNISKLIQKLCYEQTKRFIIDVTQPLGRHSSSSSLAPGMESSEDFNKQIQFKFTTKLTFDHLAEEGEMIVKKYSNTFMNPSSSLSSLPTSPSPLQLTPRRTMSTESPQSSSLLTLERLHRLDSKEESKHVTQSPQITPRERLETLNSTSTATTTTATTTITPTANLGVLLSEFEKELSLSLSEYEQNVCNTMERLSEMSLEAIRKKFNDLNAVEDLPPYVTDIKRRIEEKGALVSTSSEYTEILQENLTVEFEERIRQSYEWLIEQQMNRLRRIQGAF